MNPETHVDPKPHLCFVAHNGYGAFRGSDSGFIGGSEWQRSLMARWFAACGYQVSAITWQEGDDGDEVVDSMKILKLCRARAGIWGVRFLHPYWTSLSAALKRANADIYYCNNADRSTGLVAAWCVWHRRRFVFSIASDPACDGSMPLLRRKIDRLLYRFGVRNADLLISQTRKQQQMLQEGFGRHAEIVPMPCPAVADAQQNSSRLPPSKTRPGSVIWVGRAVELKRFEWFLEIATALPSVEFEVAMALNENEETPYTSALLSRAASITNVRVHLRVPREKMSALYRRATCLVCTSRYEGFPNTFLEAWSCGIPVVSTVDPDGIIESRGLGSVATDLPALIRAVRKLLADPKAWLGASEKGKQYYEKHHTVDTAMSKFEAAFLTLHQTTGKPQSPGHRS